MKRFAALALLLATLGFSSNQALSRNDIYGAIGSGFTWASTTPAWSGDHTLVTKSDFVTYVKNNGNCAPGASNNYVMVYSDMQACAVNVVPVAHSPLLANNTFSGGSFASWTADTTSGSCTGGFAFTGQSTTDEDGDNGESAASSTCYTNGSTFGTFGLAQTFSLPTTSTSQSYSFWYKAPYVSVGDATNCTGGSGVVQNLVLKINGTTAVSIATPAADGAWHQVSGTAALYVSGSNTIDLSVQLSGASGVNQQYNRTIGDYVCTLHVNAAQPFYVDNFSLSATY